MRTIPVILALLLPAAVGACAGDVSSPGELASRPLLDEGGTNCDYIIYDDGTCDPAGGGGGYDRFYYETLNGNASVDYDLGYAEAPSYADGALATCPPGFQGWLLPANATDDGDPYGRPLPFVSSGWWGMVFSQLYPFPFTRYVWPDGFWDATDGSGRSISIGTGDASCAAIIYPDGRVGVRVNFYAFHDIEIRRPRTGEQSTGGGGDGGGGTCYQEWLVLEINYGDGTGWHVLWEGWGEVCQ